MKNTTPLERLREAPEDGSRELARRILTEAEQLRRFARNTVDTAIHDELMALAGHCDASAAAILSRIGGYADKLTSQLSQK